MAYMSARKGPQRAGRAPTAGPKSARMNRLYYGDNLHWLPEISPSRSIWST